MKYENVLLIGGPRDGEWTSVIAGVPGIKLCVLPKKSARIVSQPPDVQDTIDEVFYRRYPIQSSQAMYTSVYVCGDVDVLAALINGYHGGREAFEKMADKRGYNTEQYEGRYVISMTQELYDFWSGSPK